MGGSVFSKRGRAELVAQDLQKPKWGNHDANVRFIEATGLLRIRRRVLEIGCGKGYLLQHLQADGHDVTGIDTDSELVAECLRRFSALPVFEVSGTALPFPNSEFDIVMSFDVFEHIPDSDHHLSEVRRVLKPDGHYLLQTPNKWTNVLFEPIRFARKYGLSNTFTFLRFPHHCALHNYWQLARRFRFNGFETEFYDVPVVNEFFRGKINRFLGKPGLMALKVINPDSLPLPLRTNFFLKARKLP